MRKKGLVILLLLIPTLGCLSYLQEGFTPFNSNENIAVVKKGDTVEVNYILATTDEIVLDTSFPEVANWGLNASLEDAPVLLKLGDGRVIEGFEKALIGMKVGEQKEVLIPPDKAFGNWSEEHVKTFSRTSHFPRTDVISRNEFTVLFQDEPIEGRVYSMTFWNLSVLEIAGNEIKIVNNAINGSFDSNRGSVVVEVADADITVRIDPIINSTVITLDGVGKVIAVSDASYTVDLNHPLAGQSLLIFVRVEKIIKPSESGDGNQILGRVVFMTSLSNARALSNSSGNPIFLYVHAPWCGWCRKFEADVLSDEDVVKILEEDFINVAVDVDTKPELARELGIFGTPTMIFYMPDGIEIERIRGYRDADSFKEALLVISSSVILAVP